MVSVWSRFFFLSSFCDRQKTMLHRNLLRLEAGATMWYYVDFIILSANVFYFIVFSILNIFLTQSI